MIISVHKAFVKFFFVVPVIIIIGFGASAFASDDFPTPVTDELLRKLGLDRDYHICISVADGDTLTLKDLGTIRFVGVDTPEKNHPKLPVQFMSKEASAFTKKHCLGKNIRLEYDPYDEDKRGKYGRVLGYLYLEDGTYMQEELIKNGYAIAYTKYPLDENRKAQFLAREQEARNKGIGLWKDSGLPEILWILEQKHPLLQVTKISKDGWRIGFGNWILEPIQYGEIERNLEHLYSSIYEFSPRELQDKLRELQYKKKPSNSNDLNNIFVIGMAHTKWGIIFQNYALPRVLPGQLDVQLEKLSDVINDYNDDELRQVLLKAQYRLIPKSFVSSVEPNRIANTFLTIYEVKTSGKDIIPWDLAGNYIGKHMTVEGKITRTHNSGKACFLNFHNNFTRYMSLVIFASDFKKFPKKPEEFYMNKRVHVSGKIKEYKESPEIILKKPEQVTVIE
jgi:endonuclease YncB( thermonuclease family)